MPSIEPQLLLPAALVGAACLLALRSPGAAFHRLADPHGTRRPDDDGAAARLLRGRPDAPPWGHRLGLGVLVGAALAVAAVRLLPDAGWWPLLTALPVAAVVVVLLGMVEPGASQRRQRRLVWEVPQALELMADGLAAGLPLRAAGAAVVDAFDGPVAEELGVVLRSVELGVGEATAWGLLAGHPQLGEAAVDLARSVESGTELVAALRHHAAAAREGRRAALQERARAVGVRSVLPLMVCFIPAFLLLGVVPTVVSAVQQAFR